MERPTKPESKSPPLLNGQERTRRTTIRPRSSLPHKLLEINNSLPGISSLWEGRSFTAYGHHSSELCQPERRNEFRTTLPTDHINVDLVKQAENLPSCRTWFETYVGQMWLETQPGYVPMHSSNNGTMEIDLFASQMLRQLPRFYSWRPDSEAEATDAFVQN